MQFYQQYSLDCIYFNRNIKIENQIEDSTLYKPLMTVYRTVHFIIVLA